MTPHAWDEIRARGCDSPVVPWRKPRKCGKRHNGSCASEIPELVVTDEVWDGKDLITQVAPCRVCQGAKGDRIRTVYSGGVEYTWEKCLACKGTGEQQEPDFKFSGF